MHRSISQGTAWHVGDSNQPLGRAFTHTQQRTTHNARLTPKASTQSMKTLVPGEELDDAFSGLVDAIGMMTVAGFGSLLSGAL